MVSKYTRIILAVSLTIPVFLLLINLTEKETESDEIPDYGWFETQRAYPFAEIPNDERVKSLEYVRNRMSMSKQLTDPWTLAGPTNVEGRITTIAIDPGNPQIVYTGCANGGVWKSTNFCQSWVSVFDNQNTSSIGALAINPLSSNVIYCGTGEPNSLRSYYPGTGIYKSTNYGLNWVCTGLQNTYSIGNIAIDPVNTNIVYAAALGSLRHNNPERGVYKSTDAGNTWSLSLFVADSVGAVDVVTHPINSNVVFAAMWERTRREDYVKYGGPKSALYISTNAGTNWTVVNGGFPSNTSNLGRISIDISPSNPQTIYTLLSNTSGYTSGLYKSTDGGTSWTNTNTSIGGSSNYAWFNRVVKVDPGNPNHIFCGGLYMEISNTGGSSVNQTLSSIHVDHHAVCFARTNPNYIVIGNDGGINYSTNNGSTFTESPTLPVTQFYAGDISYQNPNVLIGGAQDNGTNLTSGGIGAWNSVYGGDGFYCLIDYQNPQRMYASSQNGSFGYSTNGGASFYGGTSGLDLTYSNWSTPLVMDKNTPTTLYCGTFKVYRTTNGMQSWTAISPDLAKAHVANLGTITTLDVSKTNTNVLYAGTDDANVWVTTNGGTNWALINAGLPNRWVTRLTIDPSNANICYVTLSGYKVDSTGAHVFRTTNYGTNWTAINGNLPDAPVNDILVDPFNSSTLYTGTDYGVMVTTNLGQTWSIFGNLPTTVPVHDLTLHQPTSKIIAWTHGRSAYSNYLSQIQYIQPGGSSEPVGFALYQNYPNPFNPSTTIKFSITENGKSKSEKSFVTLSVYDILGKKVTDLIKENLISGTYEIPFSIIRYSGNNTPSGIYFYSLYINGEKAATRKMVLLK
ncbi:MAG: T9SS type A sorting domain-containing protein [Bacteroidetes bacterium]|nr:T9SS type A sorting domain-containing protein [Bacteroidota bacterium]